MAASRFFYDSYAIDVAQGTITYTYRTDWGRVFTHVLTFEFPKDVDIKALEPAVFTLGMAELVHYWKAILSKEIVIRAGYLFDEQVAFWETLYTKGLGEFFYVNKIDYHNLFRIVVDPSAPLLVSSQGAQSSRALVPFGGGKDSLVTGERLKKMGKAFAWFELEPLPIAKRLQQLSGVTDRITMGRDVARNFAPIIELVSKGAPNGHVPITATYMCAAVVAAKAYGFSDVVLSLERSASEGNVEYLGETINHQYSKSFEFEKLMDGYIQKHLDPSLRLFSLLRRLYELQIVREFITYPQYLPHFISCNRGLKTGVWCGSCAKCAFMFAALSAFLPPEQVVEIFKKNLYEDESLLPLYRDLAGLGGMKPFDCVGTFDENLLALYLSGKQYTTKGLPLPLVLAELPIYQGEHYTSMLSSSTDEHLIPKEYL